MLVQPETIYLAQYNALACLLGFKYIASRVLLELEALAIRLYPADKLFLESRDIS